MSTIIFIRDNVSQAVLLKVTESLGWGDRGSVGGGVPLPDLVLTPVPAPYPRVTVRSFILLSVVTHWGQLPSLLMGGKLDVLHIPWLRSVFLDLCTPRAGGTRF